MSDFLDCRDDNHGVIFQDDVLCCVKCLEEYKDAIGDATPEQVRRALEFGRAVKEKYDGCMEELCDALELKRWIDEPDFGQSDEPSPGYEQILEALEGWRRIKAMPKLLEGEQYSDGDPIYLDWVQLLYDECGKWYVARGEEDEQYDCTDSFVGPLETLRAAQGDEK